MKTKSLSQSKSVKSQTFKIIKMLAGIVALTLIVFFWYSWIVDTKKEEAELTDIASKSNVAGTDLTMTQRMSEYTKDKILITVPKTKDPKNITGKIGIIERASKPDELINGISLNKLDTFHKNQTKIISEELSNPATQVELPPSDVSLKPISMHQLDAFHRRQAAYAENESNEFLTLLDNEEPDGRQTALNRNEIDLIQQEQAKQSKEFNEWVSLPIVDTENEFSPITLRELDEALHGEQLAAEFAEVDDTTPIVLPPSSDEPHSLTNWDLIEFHAKQEQMSRQ